MRTTNKEFLDALGETIDKATPEELAQFRMDVRKKAGLPARSEPLLEKKTKPRFLNGWQRIGIILSTIWILVAYVYTLNREMAADVSTAVTLEDMCTDSQTRMNLATTRCTQDFYHEREIQIPEERETAAIVALVPVPFAWGFVYVVLFLGRWVKRGFSRDDNR